MTVIFLLIGISVLLGGAFLIAFFWSVKSGQNDDLYTPSVRMLFEDELKKDNNNSTNKDQNSTT